jgi:hypothetical protein
MVKRTKNVNDVIYLRTDVVGVAVFKCHYKIAS